jgi:hypothetical protein
MFTLRFTSLVNEQLDQLEKNPALLKRLKAVRKTLAFLEINSRHPSLNTHKYSALQGDRGEEIFEAYAENNTPAAYRIFWHYGPGNKEITIIAITAHP